MRIGRRTLLGSLGGLVVGSLLFDCYAAQWHGASFIAMSAALLACVALGAFVTAGGLMVVSFHITRLAKWVIRHGRLSLRIGEVVLIAVGIAVCWWVTRLTVNTPLRIQATTAPQWAVFYVNGRPPGSLGYGVFGTDNRGMIVDGKPVILAEEDWPKIAKQGLSYRDNCLMGYIVRGRIHMQPRTVRWTSVPGQPYRECYVVVLDWVLGVAPVTEPEFRTLVLRPIGAK